MPIPHFSVAFFAWSLRYLTSGQFHPSMPARPGCASQDRLQRAAASHDLVRSLPPLSRLGYSTMSTLHLRLLALPLLLAGTLAAQDHKWTFEAPSDVRWHRMTETGTYICVTDKGLHAIDPDSGKLLWTRPEFAKVLEFNVEEMPGLPLLFVAENSGQFSNSSTLTALNVETGQNLWKTEKLKGHMLDLVAHRPGGFVVAFTAENPGTKTALGYMGFEIVSGKVVFEGAIKDKADLFANEKSGKFMPRYDLDGHAAPAFEGDAMYIAYAGLHKIDTNSGQLLWSAPFDVTEGHFKRTNSSPIVDGGLVFSSAKGVVRAFDKATGALKWTSKDYGAAIPELQVQNGVLLARMGGTYYESAKKAYELKKPLGIIALDVCRGYHHRRCPRPGRPQGRRRRPGGLPRPPRVQGPLLGRQKGRQDGRQVRPRRRPRHGEEGQLG